MSIWATINGVDENEPVGAPYRYPGSNLVPATDWPRGGEVMLAKIPSHITRDGRDDQPEDEAPWPWLRLSVIEDGWEQCADVVLDVAQARHLAARLTAWADHAQSALDTPPAEQPTMEGHAGHQYLSTGCLHGDHGYCQNVDGTAGRKKPAQCKFCAAPCICRCHQDASTPVPPATLAAPSQPADWDAVATEALRVTVDRAARGVLTPAEGPLLRQHVEHLIADRDRLARELADTTKER